jgi:hypothetical protein
MISSKQKKKRGKSPSPELVPEGMGLVPKLPSSLTFSVGGGYCPTLQTNSVDLVMIGSTFKAAGAEEEPNSAMKEKARQAAALKTKNSPPDPSNWLSRVFDPSRNCAYLFRLMLPLDGIQYVFPETAFEDVRKSDAQRTPLHTRKGKDLATELEERTSKNIR